MPKKLLLGNEAAALGAMRAGVDLVTGYPGTPSTEALETIAKHNDGSIYIEWSVNEKAALETAAGAAFAGARTLVTMKQVGLNVASDPLMSLNYLGVKGAMVILVADDPGPISSQTEQDTRRFAKFAKLALFDPSTPEEAYTMIADAFDFSQKYGRPVMFRPTTRVCHSCASVELLGALPQKKSEGFVKDVNRWVIFPRLAYLSKFKIEDDLKSMKDEFSNYEKNILTGEGRKGIASGGVSYTYLREALANMRNDSALDCKLLKISAYPFPEKLALDFLTGLDEVLVIEELDPVIEEELMLLCGLYNLKVKILGKRTGHVQIAGENTPDSVSKAVALFLGAECQLECQNDETPPALSLPVRPPVLCAGCPHRASFFAVKEAAKGVDAVFTGDIGCYTLGNASPLNMVDTCICMGAGITAAQGLKRAEPEKTHFAFIGDSTFFHSGITGVINAVYNQTDIIVVVLDNSTTAMTGNQPHPGTGATMMKTRSEKIDIEKIVRALNVSTVVKANPMDINAAKEAAASVIPLKGVRVIIFESPCIAVKKTGLEKTGKAVVDAAKCDGCKVCVGKFGCPAISFETDDGAAPKTAVSRGKARINETLCAGCGACVLVCRLNAIKIIPAFEEGEK